MVVGDGACFRYVGVVVVVCRRERDFWVLISDGGGCDVLDFWVLVQVI
ncbi:hypothetical protein Hdeb2414_s0005g00175521 [Helianthus debilis subsp. tardiflorus]